MNTNSITINGLKLRLYTWGNSKKPRLFLIHGWVDTGASFDFLCDYLSPHFHCIAPDMRGFGKSKHSKSPLGYFFYEYIADLHAIFKKLSPHQPVKILGHSLGGAVSSFYAGAYPEKVSHFINMEGFGFADLSVEEAPAKFRNWLDTSVSGRFKVYANQESFAHRLVRQNPRLPLDRARFMTKHLTKPVKGGVTLAADSRHLMPEPHYFSKAVFYAFWKKIRARCLLISAELTNMNDWVKAENLSAEIQEWLSHYPAGTKQITLSDCGHMVHHEKPKELAKNVLDFLKPANKSPKFS